MVPGNALAILGLHLSMESNFLDLNASATLRVGLGSGETERMEGGRNERLL